MIGKIIITILVCISIAFLLQTYAANLFNKIIFTAPIIGSMSVAACIISGIAAVCMAKVSFGKN